MPPAASIYPGQKRGPADAWAGPALAGLLFRGLLLWAIFWLFGVTWSAYVTTSDAGSFLPVAHALTGGISPGPALTEYDTRVFPGWPLLVAPLLALGLPEPAALVLALLLFALSVGLYHRLTHDRIGTWLLAFFPAAWVLTAVHPISEPAYLCLVLAGCLAVRSRAWFLAGLAAGGLVAMRPFGLAWVLAFGWVLSRQLHAWRGTLAYLGGGAVMAAVLAGLNLALYHDVIHQLRVYARPLGELNVFVAPSSGGEEAGHWGWPFHYLLATPFRHPVPLWKIVYVYGTVALFLGFAAAAIVQLRREADVSDWERAAMLGFLLNTAFSLCAGPYWGFHSIDRYLVWGLPGALVAIRPWWPRAPWLPWLLATTGIAMSAASVWNRFHLPIAEP